MTRLFIPDRRLILAPAIWPHGRTREIEVVAPGIRYEGWITAELIHARTGLVKRHLSFRNLVTDAGLNAIGSTTSALASDLTNYLAVGTGSAAPAVGDTTLGAEAGRTNSNGGFADTNGSGASFAYWYYRKTRNFTEAQANGNLTELGLFSASTGGTLWARQLFKDGVGAPTTIVKTSADQLRITWETRAYSPTVDASGNTTISGTSYAWVTRACEIDQGGCWGTDNSMYYGAMTGRYYNMETIARDAQTLATVTGTPAYTQTASISDGVQMPVPAYVSGSFQRDIENIFEPSVANFTGGGVGHMLHGIWRTNASRPFQTSFTPKFAKDSTKRLKVTFRYSWARL